jgi:hypothetical protein
VNVNFSFAKAFKLTSIIISVGIFTFSIADRFDKTGNLVRHKEDISKSDLPAKVLNAINTAYSSYRIDDLKKITKNGKDSYRRGLKNNSEEWKIGLDAEGKELSKMTD